MTAESNQKRPLSDWRFESDDQFELLKFATQLLQYIHVEQHFIHGSLVVSLEAPFGSGKSAFLSMWRNHLLDEQRKTADAPMPVLINAWEDDYCGDPLLSIVASLVKAIEGEYSDNPTQLTNRLRNAANQVAWFGIGLANSFVSSSTGLDVAAAAKLAEEKTACNSVEVPDAVQAFENRREALTELKNLLASQFGSTGRCQAVVIIDELDRCRPDYAISYLETIKHIFDIPGLTFVLAIDRNQLSSSARTLFGSDLDVHEYFRKFITRSLSLPRPENSLGERFLQKCLDRFFELPEVRQTNVKLNRNYLILNLFISNRLTPRQTEEVFRILGHVFARKNGQSTLPTYVHAFFLMAILKVKEADLYKQIGEDRILTAELFVRLKGFAPDARDFEYWTTLCYSAMQTSRDEPSYGAVLQEAFGETRAETVPSANQLLQTFSHDWENGCNNCLCDLYRKIENAISLGD